METNPCRFLIQDEFAFGSCFGSDFGMLDEFASLGWVLVLVALMAQ
jgi:hypothetical protein